jgi:hypothetical protein
MGKRDEFLAGSPDHRFDNSALQSRPALGVEKNAEPPGIMTAHDRVGTGESAGQRRGWFFPERAKGGARGLAASFPRTISGSGNPPDANIQPVVISNKAPDASIRLVARASNTPDDGIQPSARPGNQPDASIRPVVRHYRPLDAVIHPSAGASQSGLAAGGTPFPTHHHQSIKTYANTQVTKNR